MAMLAYELNAGLITINQRDDLAGDAVYSVRMYFQKTVTSLDKDRSPGPDVEQILNAFNTARFQEFIESL